MATKSVTPAALPSATLASDTHWLDDVWDANPMDILTKLSLKSSDQATKGAAAIAGVLHRDFLARLDVDDSVGENRLPVYPLLGKDDHDRLFIALQCLLRLAENGLDDVREKKSGSANPSREKANV